MDDKRIKVMVVEDSTMIVQRLYTILSEIKFIKSIVHAKDGNEALTLMNLLQPELILLDIKMPGMNGIEVLKLIKQNPQPTHVVMLTNYPTAQYKELCISLGADHFLDKSTEFEHINEIVTSMQNKILVN